MNKNSLVPLLAGALIAVLVVEEIRIQGLRDELAAKPKDQVVKEKIPTPARQASAAESLPRTVTAERSEQKEEQQTALEGFGKAMRKMAENPAAQEMFKTAHIAHARMIYGPLLKKLNLSENEEEYFLGVISGEMADQQSMGMKMMGAKTPEDRQAIAKEMEENKQERKKLVAEFLNDESDTKEFEHYNERLPEHQQMNGIRTAIAQTGTPLNSEQEAQLVEIMHGNRTGSPEAKKWDGPEAMETLAREDVVEVFEADWTAGQETLANQVSELLEDDQKAAFFENQEQMKQMHLMGIKMMQNMMSPKGE